MRLGIVIALQLMFEHDLFGKPLHTFPDHALGSHLQVTAFAAARFTGTKHVRVMVATDAKQDGVAVMKPDSSALEVRGLTKRFDRLAVDSLDLTIHAGEFYALVGPN